MKKAQQTDERTAKSRNLEGVRTMSKAEQTQELRRFRKERERWRRTQAVREETWRDDLRSIEASDVGTRLSEAAKYLKAGHQLLRSIPIDPFGRYNPAVNCLADFAASFSNELCQRALDGNQTATTTLWNCAHILIETIHHVAQKQPEQLQQIARKALFLPSFRARPRKFTHNFNTVARAIQLSDDFLMKMDETTLQKLDSPITGFVLRFVQDVSTARSTLKNIAATFDCPNREEKRRCEEALKDYLIRNCGFLPVQLPYMDLPEFGSDKVKVDAWWRLALEPHLEDPNAIARIQGTELHAALFQSVKNRLERISKRKQRQSSRKTFQNQCEPKDYQLRDTLKKRARQALGCLAKLIRPPAQEEPSRLSLAEQQMAEIRGQVEEAAKVAKAKGGNLDLKQSARLILF